MNFTRRNLLAAGAILSLPGFASSAFAAETVTVPSQTGDVAVPVDPKRLAVLDISILENLAYFGLSDRVVGSVTPGTVTWAKAPAGAKPLGGMKTIDIPAVKSVNPDLVFISGRVARAIDEFRQAAPTSASFPTTRRAPGRASRGISAPSGASSGRKRKLKPPSLRRKSASTSSRRRLPAKRSPFS